MRKVKQIIAGLMFGVMVVGLAAIPKEAKATEATEVIYDDSLSISAYWNKDNKQAPVKKGYVFGGWYTKDSHIAISEGDITYDEIGNATNTNVTAKFVPAYVLSVKTQIALDTYQANGTTEDTYIRLISSVDCLDYNEVGFGIWYNKTNEETEGTALSKVYSSIKNNDANGGEPITPANTFGAVSTHFSVLRVSGIAPQHCDKVIYVRPYWITADGTKVEGLSSYVRVMDGYKDNRFISVPVNLLSGENVAAGSLTLSYDADKVEVIENDYRYDTGVLLPEMSFNNDISASKVRIVANDKTFNDQPTGSGIYANVWFRVKDGVTLTAGEKLNFTMGDFSFCNWHEEMALSVDAQNVVYQY